MKKRIIQLAGLMLLATGAYAQTEVTVGVMRGKDYGVTYLLPKTEIELTIVATKHTYTPGEFCKYAEQFLKLTDVSPISREYWTLDKIETAAIGVPDKEKVYFVKMKDKTVAPLMELTEDGIVRSINMPYSGTEKKEPASATINVVTQSGDPRTFLTEEILMASSTAKMAELVAQEIYNIRESKNILIRGEADNMPKDGEQLKLMLDNLTLQEKSLTEMFTGKTIEQSKTYTVRVVPQEMDHTVAVRFSTRLGVIDSRNLAGEPVYINITDLKTINIPPLDEKDSKKKIEGIAYNAPGRAKIEIIYKQQTLFEDELPISQFGTTEYLSPDLFNKNSVTQVLFDTTTGGLLKVSRGE